MKTHISFKYTLDLEESGLNKIIKELSEMQSFCILSKKYFKNSLMG